MKPKVSFAITVCDEYEELQALTEHLKQHVDLTSNEIVILCDQSKATNELSAYCRSLKTRTIHPRKGRFRGDFARWKNRLKALCKGEFIFHIDADEIPHQHLLLNLDRILKDNPFLDIIWVPRENYVDGISAKEILDWGWTIDAKGRVNFPDYQSRIFRNAEHIRWSMKVHESIVGSDKQAPLPQDTIFSLMHRKTIAKQKQQMRLYSQLLSADQR